MQDGSGFKLNGELPQRGIQHVLQADNYDAWLRARSADLRAPGRAPSGLRDLQAKSRRANIRSTLDRWRDRGRVGVAQDFRPDLGKRQQGQALASPGLVQKGVMCGLESVGKGDGGGEGDVPSVLIILWMMHLEVGHQQPHEDG